jgi:hypothetical protein
MAANPGLSDRDPPFPGIAAAARMSCDSQLINVLKIDIRYNIIFLHAPEFPRRDPRLRQDDALRIESRPNREFQF